MKILIAALALSAAAHAAGPSTELLVRVDTQLRYYHGCDVKTNILGAAEDGVLFVDRCAGYGETSIDAPAWSDGAASYRVVFMPDQVFGACGLVRQQLIAGGQSSISIECGTPGAIFRDGFEP